MEIVKGRTVVDVCVLIPCFNNPEGLSKSLSSISYHPGKLIVVVVDDGSAQPVFKKLIQSCLSHDILFHIVTLHQNSGITIALNEGLQWIFQNLEAQFVARLDCEDTCHPDRFYEQVRILEQNPSIGLVGSWCLFKHPATDFSYSYTTPTEHEGILFAMNFRNVFIHPTVMFRIALIEKLGGYPFYPYVEDYALFYQMLLHMKGAIINRFLVTCAINPAGISHSNRKAQLQGRAKIVSEYGTNRLAKVLALLKLKLLMVIPYSFILYLKKK